MIKYLSIFIAIILFFGCGYLEYQIYQSCYHTLLLFIIVSYNYNQNIVTQKVIEIYKLQKKWLGQ